MPRRPKSIVEPEKEMKNDDKPEEVFPETEKIRSKSKKRVKKAKLPTTIRIERGSFNISFE